MKSIGSQLDDSVLMFTGVERSVLTLRKHGQGMIVEFTHRDSELNMATRIYLDRDDMISLTGWLVNNFPFRTPKDDGLDELDALLEDEDEGEVEDTDEGPLDGSGEGTEEDRLG